MSDCVVIGGGPSRDMYSGPVDYACNIAGMMYEPKYLCSSDPWLQYDIIRSGYRGVCLFVDFGLLPIELPPESFIEGHVPADYDYVLHNPEQREGAIGWHFYSTGDTMNEHWEKTMSVKQGYWRPKRAYACFVPSGMNIHNIENIEPERGQLAPSGAYAIYHAIQNGAKEIDAYGFDSIAGDMYTVTQYDEQNHTDVQRDHFLQWYKRISEMNEEVNIRWHMKKD